MNRQNSMPNIDELLDIIKALEDADHWGSTSLSSSSQDSPVFKEQLKEIKALEDANYWASSSLPPQGTPEPEDDPVLDELLKEIRALEDADYWASPPSQDEPEDDSAFDEQLKEIKALGDADHRAFLEDEPEDDSVFNEQLKEIKALGDADYYWASTPSQDEPEDDSAFDEQLKEIKAFGDADHRAFPEDEPEDDSVFNEQLKEIKALGDADYWTSLPSSQDDPEDDPASGAPPEEIEDSDEPNDWPHPAPSKFDDRRLVPAHFDLAFRPSSSVQTYGRSDNGRGDMALAVVTSGLTGLRDGAAITGIPYISPIASLLLLVVNIRGVRQKYDDDWTLVVDKLQSMTFLLNNFGNWCALHGLEERDLPQSLREIFQALRTKLDGIMRELNQIKKARSFMKKIFPTEMVRRLKQCDGKLSNLLQTFQIALDIDARLAQIKVNKSRHDSDQHEDQTGALVWGDSDSC